MAAELKNYNGYLPLVFAAMMTIVIAWLIPTVVTNIETRAGDYIWQLVGNNAEIEQRIIVIDIDEKSVARYGGWPWSREKVAELASKARQNDVSMLIFDMVFPAAKKGDNNLADELGEVPSVLAQILAIDANDSTHLGALKGGWIDPSCEMGFPVANAVIANNPSLVAAASSAGHITPNVDFDGVIRSIPSIICFQKKGYPALALAAITEAYELPPKFEIKNNNGWWESQQIISSEAFPDGLTIPIGAKGTIELPWWLSRKAIVSVSAAELLEGTIPASILEGKWAIIGSTAFGAGDSVVTPQGAVVGGVEVHVQLLSALLDDRVPFVPLAAPLLQMLFIVIIALILGFSAKIKSSKIIYIPLLLAFCLSLIVVGVHALLLWSLYILIPWIYAVIFSMLSGLLIVLFGYATSRRESITLYQNLSSYLPLHAAKWVAAKKPVDMLDARHEQVLVLQAKLRNFSAWCDYLPAKQSGAVLHAFYTMMEQIIHRHGGEIEEYVAGSVTAVWRNELPDRKALQAVKEIISQSEKMFGNETKNDSVPPLAVGIGIEYGEVLAGSFGPSQRRTYTVIGKAVTTAVHLQNLTADLAVHVLIGELAASAWQKEDNDRKILESLGEFLLQDSANSIRVHTLAEEIGIS